MSSTQPQWLGKEPEYIPEQCDEIIETDVIVCGAGTAGVAAAREAAELGAQCVLFEKTAKVQGRSGQFCLIGGEFIKRWGIDNAGLAPEIVNELMFNSCYRPKARILDYAIRHSGPDFDWYLDGLPHENVFIADAATDVPPAGTKTHVMLMQHPVQPKYDITKERYPVHHVTVQIRPSHVGVLANNLELGRATGRLECRFETPVKRLLRDGFGRVTGVIAENFDGKTVWAKARKGVILATGDYSGDPDMLAQYCPWLVHNKRVPLGFDRDRKPINSGDGHRMGLWAGAKMEEGPHAGNAHNMGTAIGATPFLMLDLDGRRFMNEECPGAYLEAQLSNLRERTAWQFFDSDWPEQVPEMPFGHGSASRVLDEDAVRRGESFDDLTPMDGYASQGFIDKCIERGQAFRADTLEELIALTGLPRETALAQIERYNELARWHRDDDFGKTGRRMFPIEHGPFYANKIQSALLLCCHGGLESDEYAHVLGEDRLPIPGLYACGNVQGNRIVVDYPTTAPGLSHTLCLTFGRQAARSCVDGV